jgi:hypothetical protein
MQVPRSLVSIALAGLIVAACGGGGPTQAPGATQGPGGGPTQAPGATQGPDGGPTIDPNGGPILPGLGSGQVRFEVSGSLSRNGELPFFGLGSRFEGEAGKYYAFTAESDNTEIVTIFESGDGWLVGYASESGSASATVCEMSNLNTTDTHAAGTFDCPNTIIVKPDGTYATDGRIKGSFEANK